MAKYQVLARKYRPKDFSQLVGQTHVSNALSNAIDSGRIHHAYLFTGTRGVGKTTIARILAKCLNCETGITSHPCGVCDTCMSIDSGRFIDLIEIDAASRTKVEDTRDLLENVPYAPTQGRYKVYLIDEVHMLSTHSFNALLKTLEEPPEHAKFILATTDPQKLPITIVSRCLQFVLRSLSQELLHHHLANILSDEHIQYDDAALWQLAQSAKGSVRDALSLTDQAIAFGNGHLGSDTVLQMLGLVDSLDVLTLIWDIVSDNRQRVAEHINRMRSQMVDAVAILDKLVDSFHQLALLQVLPDIPLDMNQEHQQRFVELSQTISSDVLQLYYEIAAKSRDSVKLASTPMQALEMGILRLLAFRPLANHETIVLHKPIENQEIENQEIENQEIENQEIENQEIENQEIENQEIENQEIENNNHSSSVVRQQIYEQIIAPKCELVGAWTAEKWDYWMSLARQNQWLDVDELALISRSMMVGNIDGACQLYVPDDNKQVVASFLGFAKKFTTLCPNSQLDKKMYLLSNDEKIQMLQTPAIKRELRYQKVLIQAQEQLLNSPVLQALWQGGYIDDKADGAIFETKLLLSAPNSPVIKS